jgi:hypothetical protein
MAIKLISCVLTSKQLLLPPYVTPIEIEMDGEIKRGYVKEASKEGHQHEPVELAINRR